MILVPSPTTLELTTLKAHTVSRGSSLTGRKSPTSHFIFAWRLKEAACKMSDAQPRTTSAQQRVALPFYKLPVDPRSCCLATSRGCELLLRGACQRTFFPPNSRLDPGIFHVTQGCSSQHSACVGIRRRSSLCTGTWTWPKARAMQIRTRGPALGR